MIVQQVAAGAAPEHPHFVIAQLEHSRLAGTFAEAWGNDEFASLEPRDLMIRLAFDHDCGWDVVDDELGCDPTTGLPWHLIRTPLPALLRSSRRGPDLNEAIHPLLGLLSSMHTWGLFHGRYGLSDKIFVKLVPPEHRGSVDEMLAYEQARQARLRAKLASTPDTAPWVEESRLFHNYKLLQFFDTLALYFNCTAAADRAEAKFSSVPVRIGHDVPVTVRPLGSGRYQVSPYPFLRAPFVVTCTGRWLRPHVHRDGKELEDPAAGARAFAAAPDGLETFVLEPAPGGVV